MIVTITMNPTVDKSTTVDKLVPEKKMRCSSLLEEAGGGGINISKALKELGEDSLAIFPSGGPNGATLTAILNRAGVRYQSIPIGGNTRESFTATESSTNGQYRFVMPGCALTEAEIEACFAAIHGISPAPGILIASGSLPPGVPENFFARLAGFARQQGIRLIVDASGKPLQLAAEEGVYLLKPNLSELGTLSGKDFLELSEVEEAARSIISKGLCEVVVVSMGPAGAMLVTKDDYKKVGAPTVRKKSTVGAGDSMVAGMAWMLERGNSLQDMLCFGVACGTAATMNEGTHLFKKDDVWKLYNWICTA